MKKVVLDTNVVIEILRGNENILSQISHYELYCLPVTVCGELLFGAYNSTKVQVELIKYQHFLSIVEVLEINIAVVENYAIIRNSLKRKGKPIPENDIWIAAVAMTNDLLLFSNDNHFSMIDGIDFEYIEK